MLKPQNLPHYSLKSWMRASFLLLTLAGGAQAALADDYEVDNVAVEATGKDTANARTQALAKGEKDAFSQLMLKRDPVHATDIFKKVSAKQVSNSVRSYNITDEKMTATEYRATVTYHFEPRAIQALAPESAPMPHPAPPSASVASPIPSAVPLPPPPPAAEVRKAVLVLPIYKSKEGLELWQDDNSWRNAWYDAALISGGGLVVVPLGDTDDRIDVDDTNVMGATPQSLKRMYDRYGVGDILIASAYFNAKADPKPTLEVTLRRLSQAKPDGPALNYIIHTAETQDALLARASNDIAHTLFKQQTIDPNKIETDRLKDITARIDTNDIREWQALRKRLLMRSNIVDVKFISISYYETTMTITFKGTPEMLGKTLVASGLRVQQDGDILVLSLK